MVSGDRLMVTPPALAARTVTAIHSHVHEQMTIVEHNGRADFSLRAISELRSSYPAQYQRNIPTRVRTR
jgi:hypothetical protein